MLQRYEAKVIEKPKQIKAKYGFCSFIKLQLISNNEEVVIFSKENDANVLKRYKGEIVECYQDNNQKWKLLTTIPSNNSNGSNGSNGNSSSNENIQMNRLSHKGGVNRDYYTYNSSEINSNPSTEEDIEDIIEDVPMLSNADKKKIAKFIDQQAALYKYTVNAVKKEFPELEGIDDRGIRSIALSLLINTNMVINRNL